MKYILIIALFFSFSANAQVDSNAVRHKLTLQVRDWYKVESFVQNKQSYERLYDSLKFKLRATPAPYNSTAVGSVDSIPVRNLIGIAMWIRNTPYSDAYFYFERINTAIRSINDAYLQRRLDELDAHYYNLYSQSLLDEYNRVRNPQ